MDFMDARPGSAITGNVTQEEPLQAETTQHISHRSFKVNPFAWWSEHRVRVDLILLIIVAIAALLPRIILATQLDMVTDEVVYILGGKIYLPLALHLNIGAAGWSYNYEHPPFVKLLIGSVLAINVALGHLLPELFAARIPSIIFGTLLVIAVYWLGKGIFGRQIALAAALCLAFSPWLVYFSALAYLDMTMTALITIAYLVSWYATRRPWLYIVVALLVALGADSKYTGVLVVPALILFTLYYFFALRPYQPAEQRPQFPWRWWLIALPLSPLIFLASDPAIWPHPISLLIHSFTFEWDHSVRGHLTFIAGQYGGHVPHWSILYILLNKITLFATFPAAFFVIYAFVQLFRFHTRRAAIDPIEAARIAYLLIWLLAIVGMFSLLNIVVGTHYHLPAAAPVVLAGTFGLIVILRYVVRFIVTRAHGNKALAPAGNEVQAPSTPRAGVQNIIVPALLITALALPHLIGLIVVPDAEGYTSEIFPGENTTLQVAYPGYRNAVEWLASYTNQPAKVGLVALPGTLNSGGQGVSWFDYNKDLPSRFQLSEAHPGQKTYAYDYLVWPMHLVQRGYAIPPTWRAHTIHVVMGGRTTYCYILAAPR
jgi:4-amino-4-deoxy-L-arabinose transferase-like glycosyltransferase